MGWDGMGLDLKAWPFARHHSFIFALAVNELIINPAAFNVVYHQLPILSVAIISSLPLNWMNSFKNLVSRTRQLVQLE